MKNENSKKQIFPVKLSKLIITLSIICILLCLAGIGVTIYRIIANNGLHNVSDYFKYPFLILVCVLCIAIIISIFVCAKYTVGEQKLITQFGIIKSTYDIQEFSALNVDLKTNKLTVYQGESFFVLSIPRGKQDEFIRAILEEKPSLEVSYNFKDDAPPKEEKKEDK